MSGSNFADPVVRGIDGIVVTNHAGRQVDGAIASLDALERIVDAVGDNIYVCLHPFHGTPFYFTTSLTGGIRSCSTLECVRQPMHSKLLLSGLDLFSWVVYGCGH